MNSQQAEQSQWVERLAHELEQKHGGSLEWVQTHISHVLLTPSHAYKIKKALNLGFVDFTTLASRKAACEEELRLNRRTAPELYIDVVGVDEQGKWVGPEERGAVDYAVRMRRFESGHRFDELLAAGALTPELMDQLVDAVVGFHRSIPSVREVGAGSPTSLRQASGENVQQLLALVGGEAERALIERHGQWLQLEEGRLAGLLEARVRDGFVRDAHGDLHLANVCLFDGQVTLFDCLEFSRPLRCIDVINDVAFLVMDLFARGAAPLGWRALNRYLEITGDYEALPLLRYYVAYRAAVRLKVQALSGGPSQGSLYLKVLSWVMAPALEGVVITHGLSGSGKTVLSQHFLEQVGAIRVRSDVERKRLHGMGSLERPRADQHQSLYSAQVTQHLYAHLLSLARGIAASGFVAVIDATFLSVKHRQCFKALAQELGLVFLILHCEASIDTLRERLSARHAAANDASDADEQVLAQQMHESAPLLDEELAEVVWCDMSLPLSHWANPQTWKALLIRPPFSRGVAGVLCEFQ